MGIEKYKSVQDSAKLRITQLEHQILEMQALLEQEKADIATADWGTVGSLGHIVAQTEETLIFWRGGKCA